MGSNKVVTVARKSISGKSIALALGSGGARGLAHVGVLETLMEEGINIDALSGCSMGALVGGVFARGKLEEFKKWACALQKYDVWRLVDFSFGRQGLIKGTRVMELLQDLIGDADIGNLDIDYTAVATDLTRRREVWMSEGSLFEAIRASIAIPSLLTPYVKDGRVLVDGGLLNPVPISPLLRSHAELTIAVNLSGDLDPEMDSETSEDTDEDSSSYRQKIGEFVDGLQDKLRSESSPSEADQGMVDVMLDSFDIMQNTITRIKLATHAPDIIINVPRNTCQSHEYWRAQHAIEVGAQATKEALARWRG